MSDTGTDQETNVLTQPSTFITRWKDSHVQAHQDLRSRGPACGLCCLVYFWLSGLITSFCLVVVFTTRPGYGYLLGQTGSACLPDGNFGIEPYNYNYWFNSGFFEITLGFGRLTFTQAKFVDVVWDIFVGRGGQALLAYFSWTVFAKYVTTSMEVAPITFRTYRTVFVQNQSLILAIPCLIRDFLKRRALQSKLAMVFMVLTMIFAMIFPTFAGAMTGYSANTNAYINATDANYVPFKAFDYALYTIHDGYRVNLTDDYIVSYFSSYNENPILAGGEPQLNRHCDHSSPSHQKCEMLEAVTNYVGQFGFSGTQNISSNFTAFYLEPPILNISAFFLPNSFTALDYEADRPFLISGVKNARERSPKTWIYGGDLYTIQDIQNRGRCQPLLDYQWGFSFIQTVIMMSSLLIWTVGLLTMWFVSHRTMKRRGRTEIAGENKAVLELAHAIREQFIQLEDERDFDKTALSESGLHRRINKALNGGSIAYKTSLALNTEVEERGKKRGFMRWLRKEKWWLIAIFLSFLLAPGIIVLGIVARASFALPPFGLIAALPFDIGCAMYIGTTTRSRIIVTGYVYLFSGVLVFLVIIVPTLVAYYSY